MLTYADATFDATQLAGIMSLANLTGDSRGMQTQSHSGKPQDRLMGQLERRAEAISGDINAQDIANALWEYAAIYAAI